MRPSYVQRVLEYQFFLFYVLLTLDCELFVAETISFSIYAVLHVMEIQY